MYLCDHPRSRKARAIADRRCAQALPVVTRRARLEYTLPPVERADLAGAIAREGDFERAVVVAESIHRATLHERRRGTGQLHAQTWCRRDDVRTHRSRQRVVTGVDSELLR